MGPFKLAQTKTVPSVCPYCAVGCGLEVHVRDGQVVNIEGDPESPINEGTLCPKGAATFELVNNPQRLTHVLWRGPKMHHWEQKPLDWAMDRIAQRIQETRDETFEEKVDFSGIATIPVMRTQAIATLGGAVFDNEENYLLAKLTRALGIVSVENQARV